MVLGVEDEDSFDIVINEVKNEKTKKAVNKYQ